MSFWFRTENRSADHSSDSVSPPIGFCGSSTGPDFNGIGDDLLERRVRYETERKAAGQQGIGAARLAYRSRAFRAACAKAGLRHIRTRPYTPRTNGKAERFIQTVLRECACARPFLSSPERAEALPRWTHLYNVHRPHTALAGKPPIFALRRNNLLGINS